MTDTVPHDPVPEKCMQEALDLEHSLLAILATGAVPNRCFDNAWRTFCAFPEAFCDGAFVEGWFLCDLGEEVVLNEHGWCELANGSIVDPSILLLVDWNTPVYYFPGVRRHWEEMMNLIRQECILPYVRADGTDGLAHPEYRAAYDAAQAKMIQLAQAAHSPKKMTVLSAQDCDVDPRETSEQTTSLQFFLFSPRA